jgi:mono/diheme cytochrome c family protein
LSGRARYLVPGWALVLAVATAAAVQGGGSYERYCSQCHGVAGDGQGIAAPRLDPRPRDFTAGKFKIRNTPSGALPTDDDLRRIIRQGMPYTSMPGWPQLSEEQVTELVAAVKAFSPDFADPERQPTAIPVPKPPPFSGESAEKGKEVYQRIGCVACHGEVGRGDGSSAATLTDDWGHSIRPADLTMRWTYRGGATREDIYRTFTTGLNGTPMPSFAESLTDEERWQLVDYVVSLGPSETPNYSNLLQVQWTQDELDLARGDDLFATAAPAYFPIVGQITEPGRAFHPSAQGVTVRAVYNSREIAFQVRWHDLRADTVGRNAPNLVVPVEEEQTAPAADAGGGDFWGGEEAPAADAGGDFWGAEEAKPAAAEGGDFWGEEGGTTAAVTLATEFSDAVAIQLPAQIPTGIRKPYFLFGDAQNPVDLWFVDLAAKVAQRYVGAGSDSVTAVEGEDVTTAATFDRGRWTVILKRKLRATGGVAFAQGQYVPIAFSIWDGWKRERGNRRGLTQWMYLYTMPQEAPSPVVPMLEAAAAVLAIELLLVAWVRRLKRQREVESAAPASAEAGRGNP